jgi:hypothetical protein
MGDDRRGRAHLRRGRGRDHSRLWRATAASASCAEASLKSCEDAPGNEGPKSSAITILDEWFVAENVFDGAGVRIDLKNAISLYIVRSPDYTPILEEARPGSEAARQSIAEREGSARTPPAEATAAAGRARLAAWLESRGSSARA